MIVPCLIARIRRAAAPPVILLAFVTLAASPAHGDTGSDEAAFLSRTNSLRTSKGLAPLVLDGTLVGAARAWSAQMANAGHLSHNPSLTSQATSDREKLGENVGYGSSVDSVQQAFVNSPVHYKNLVDPAFNAVGIGVAYRSGGLIFVTVDFMRRTNAVAAARFVPPTPAARGVRKSSRAAVPRSVVARPAPAVTPAPVPPPPPEPSAQLVFVMEQLRALEHRP